MTPLPPLGEVVFCNGCGRPTRGLVSVRVQFPQGGAVLRCKSCEVKRFEREKLDRRAPNVRRSRLKKAAKRYRTGSLFEFWKDRRHASEDFEFWKDRRHASEDPQG